jgi:hypothetical protein
MNKFILKTLQISILSGSLLNFSSFALAQDLGISSIPVLGSGDISKDNSNLNSAKNEPSREEILAATFKVLNAKRLTEGKPPVDPANIDASTKKLTNSERHAFFTEIDKANVKARLAMGLRAAELYRDPSISSQGNAIAETHDDFVDNLIKGKSGITNTQSFPSSATNSPSNNTTKLDGVKDNDLTSSITMIAIGFIASRLYKYKMTTDIIMAAVGGAAFIVGEILSTGKFKEIEKNLDVQKNNLNQDQMQYLVALKKSYENSKEAAETKQKLQTAAAAAFALAAATAFFMKGLELTAEVATTSALTGSSSAAAAAAAAAAISCPETGAGCAFITPCATAASTLAADVPRRKAMNLFRDVTVAPSITSQATDLPMRIQFLDEVSAFAGMCPAVAAAPPVIMAEDLLQKINNSVGVPVAIVFNELDSTYFKKIKSFRFYELNPAVSISSTYFDKLLNLAFPKAEASMIDLLMGGAGVGAGILTGMVLTMGVTVDTFLFAPKNRGYIWGILAGLAYTAMKSSDDTIQKTNSNIQKLDLIINDMNKDTGTSVGPAALEKSINSKTIEAPKRVFAFNTPGKELAISNNPKDSTTCIASSGESSCKPLAGVLVNSPDFNLLPDSMKDLAKNMAQMGDGLSGTNKISNGTLAAIGANGSKFNAISKMLDKKKADLNAVLKKSGKSAIEFDKDQNNLLKKINDSVRNTLGKNGMTPSRFLSSIGSSLGSSGSSSNDNTNKEKPKTANVKMLDTPSSASSFNYDNKPVNAFGSTSERKTNTARTAADDLDSGKKLEGLELGNNDINTNKEESIFKVISNRYLKSGFKRLFEIKKE